MNDDSDFQIKDNQVVQVTRVESAQPISSQELRDQIAVYEGIIAKLSSMLEQVEALEVQLPNPPEAQADYLPEDAGAGTIEDTNNDNQETNE